MRMRTSRRDEPVAPAAEIGADDRLAALLISTRRLTPHQVDAARSIRGAASRSSAVLSVTSATAS